MGKIDTIHNGTGYLRSGDWAIRERDGIHWYPCAADIFAATYEPAE